MKNIKYAFVFIFSYYIGLKFPDIDQLFQSSLGHRSIITHSILLPIILFFINPVKSNIVGKILIIGLFLGIGLHLSADLHPKSWHGYANIKLPSNISIGILSPFWIAINAMIGLFLSAKILIETINKKLFKGLYVAISLSIGIYYSFIEDHSQIQIFITFLLIFSVTFYLAQKKYSKSRTYPDQIKFER